jgi:hypothetical protein
MRNFFYRFRIIKNFVGGGIRHVIPTVITYFIIHNSFACYLIGYKKIVLIVNGNIAL